MTSKNSFLVRATSVTAAFSREDFLSALSALGLKKHPTYPDDDYIGKVPTKKVLDTLAKKFGLKYQRNDGAGSPWEVSLVLGGREYHLAVNDHTTYEECSPGETMVSLSTS